MQPLSERLADRWTWWRIAEASWPNPLDPVFAATHGGRWNPPNSFPVLYLNEDQVSARMNLRAFIAQWPYEPEDLRADNGPVLIAARLPAKQDVCDAHSPAGIRALGLPATYPFDRKQRLIKHEICQPIGQAVKSSKLRGLRTRSAQSNDGAGRELAWFPATARSQARMISKLSFDKWYWA